MSQSNGQGGAAPISAAQAAQFALIFLSRANFNAGERQMYDVAEGLLRAIAEARVVLTNPPVEIPAPPPPQPQPQDTVQ